MIDAVVNFFHLLATAIWLGGSLSFFLILRPSLRSINTPQSGKLMSAVSRRFAVASLVSLLVLAVTGYIKTPERMMFDFSYGLGVSLAVKHALVILALIGSLSIGLYALADRRTNAHEPDETPPRTSPDIQKRIGILITVNTVLGLLILAFAAQLW